jgi:hypothetical protein
MKSERWTIAAIVVMTVITAVGASLFGFYGMQALLHLAQPQTVIVLPPGTTITTPPAQH